MRQHTVGLDLPVGRPPQGYCSRQLLLARLGWKGGLNVDLWDCRLPFWRWLAASRMCSSLSLGSVTQVRPSLAMLFIFLPFHLWAPREGIGIGLNISWAHLERRFGCPPPHADWDQPPVSGIPWRYLVSSTAVGVWPAMDHCYPWCSWKSQKAALGWGFRSWTPQEFEPSQSCMGAEAPSLCNRNAKIKLLTDRNLPDLS